MHSIWRRRWRIDFPAVFVYDGAMDGALWSVTSRGTVRVAYAATRGNIDPVDKWAWSINAGWISFAPACTGCEGVTIYPDHLEGYAWGENIGWIRMGTHTGGGAHTYGNTSATTYGVNRNLDGTLSGYAWGTNVGWTNFAPAIGNALFALTGVRLRCLPLTPDPVKAALEV